jgi:pseudomonalisin
MNRAIAAHQVLTPAAFTAAYGPTAAEAQQVVTYLQSQGFSGVGVSTNRLLVTATGTAGQAASAFDTVLDGFTLAGRAVFANTAPAMVPATLSGVVGSVLGLNDVGTMTTQVATPTKAAAPAAVNPASTCTIPGLPYLCDYNPQGFAQAYDATSAPTGSKTAVAIFTDGDVSGVISDLRQEEAANGLAQVPVSVVDTGPASTDTSGADEYDMDTQYSTGLAGAVSDLYLYNAPSLDDSDTTTAFNDFASQDVAKAGSASFGECEYQADLDGSLAADDEAFAEAALQGQSVFASAGDTGGFCPAPVAENGVPAGVPDVNYPAASPYVVSVGGTSLLTTSTGAYESEIAWLSGGGGVSLFEKGLSWQTGLTSTLSSVCGLATLSCGRTVPDIAMDADPNTGANVYVAGTPETVGGTSLASPLALGAWARVESAAGNGLGFAAPLLYGQAGTTSLHDITLGDTVPYPATPGYDLATGNGSIDVAQLAAALG